jgi:hypothetical protein
VKPATPKQDEVTVMQRRGIGLVETCIETALRRSWRRRLPEGREGKRRKEFYSKQ